MSKHDYLPDKYRYRRHGQDNVLLGKLALDAAFSGGFQTAEETGKEMGRAYLAQIIQCADQNKDRLEDPFYVVSLRRKQFLGDYLSNVMDARYVARQTKPELKEMAINFCSWDFEVHEVSKSKGEITLLYALPSQDVWKHVLENPNEWEPENVQWVSMAVAILEEELKKPVPELKK